MMIKTRSKIIVFCVSVLTVILILTILPLVMMFYTSIKTGGTLFETVTQILVADFDKGRTNSIGGPISSRTEGQARLEYKFVSDNVGGGRFAEISYDLRQGGDAVLWTRLGQDMRKFRRFEFYVRCLSPGEDFTVGVEDVNGNSTEVFASKYAAGGLKTSWQKISIPISDFDLSKIKPGFIEEAAENIFFRFKRPRAAAVQLDNITLYFKRFTPDNYVDVLISGPFGRYFFNSAFITLCIVLGNLLFSSMVGYVFARRDFPWKQLCFMLILGSLMIPPQVFMVPVFILMKNLNWLNTYKALILPTLLGPFNIFMMRQYISKLPVALEDAARIDGASDFQIFFRVVLPLTKPALAVVGINTFMGSWNTFLYPFILTNTPEMRTLPVGLALYKSLQGVDWVHLMAGSAITAVPVIIVFLCFQRYIIAGLTAGSTKG